MLDPSSIRRRFGIFLPLLVVEMTTAVLIMLCLLFLADLQDSHSDGITYSVHFSGTAELIVFAAAVAAALGLYLRASRWLTRRDPDDVERERRFSARVDDYNESRKPMPRQAER